MKRCLFTLAVMIMSLLLRANNITVRNTTLAGQNTASHFTLIQFDISWDNSWRVAIGPSNWDAAWVFAKYRLEGDTAWRHATLHWTDGSGSGDGHTVPTGAAIASSNDNGAGGARGIFIYHNGPLNQGTVNYQGVQLRWDYGVDGVGDADKVELRIFAIEMVYVPQGSFYLGSGGKEAGAFYTYPDTTQPYQVTSENEIPVGATNGQLYYKTGVGGDYAGPVPAAFPKGYQAFYCMKYEITQDQYVAFLNVLDSAQAIPRGGTVGVRDGITSWSSINMVQPGDYLTTSPYVPASLSYDDLAAYLDWAALRPMTELEYEKACRGTVAPVANEFAWGTPYLKSYDPVSETLIDDGAYYTISNTGLANELIDAGYSHSSGNAVWGYRFINPLQNRIARAGIFAADPSNTGRVTAGATWYGIMEMTGNLVEQVVTIGNAGGRQFTGQPGDGQLAADGRNDQPLWPQASYSFWEGAGYKGGDYLTTAPAQLMVSDRSTVTDNFRYGAGRTTGNGRGVRTAP